MLRPGEGGDAVLCAGSGCLGEKGSGLMGRRVLSVGLALW